MLTRLALVTASALSVVLAGHIPANPARAGLPDMARTTAVGHSFAVPVVAHGGPVRYYLSADHRLSNRDVRLANTAPARVSLPAAPSRSYHLLACANSRCVASRNLVTLRAKGGAQ